MVALVRENEQKATEALGEQPVKTPAILTRNSDGRTNFKHILVKMGEAGLDVLSAHPKGTERVAMMIHQGTDHTNGMNLDGDVGQWLAMIDHGVPSS